MDDESLILSLETTTNVCSVALHKGGQLMAIEELNIPRSHSKRISVMIQHLFDLTKVTPADLSAIAISEGPGSYTGLRVASSTAKGFCFALDIPMIAVPTLSGLSAQARAFVKEDAYLCPMLDARRMEVYTQVEDHLGETLAPLSPVIIEESSFSDFRNKPFYIFGDGAAKCQEMLPWSQYLDITCSASAIGRLAFEKYLTEDFVDPASFEPNYLKEFRTTVSKKSLL